MKAEGFGVAEWNCLDGNTLHRNGFFGAAPPFSAPTDWGLQKARLAHGKHRQPVRGGERNADGHRFGKRCTAVGTVMPTLFTLPTNEDSSDNGWQKNKSTVHLSCSPYTLIYTH